jgi:predicted amidohydrolase
MTALRTAVVQHDIAWEARDETLARLAPRVAAAADAGARLVVLSEMFAVGFSMNVAVTAEAEDGPSTAWLLEQAQRHQTWICGTIPVSAEPGQLPYNTFVLASPDGVVHRYRKIHPFTYGGEREAFAAGADVVTVDVEGVRVTPFVCYDLRFADVFWQAAAATDLYVVSANWPEARRRHWSALLVARAIENQAYVVGCNRVGSGGKLTYVGDSAVVSPMGDVLASAAEVETTLLVDVDPARVAEVRERFPFAADRRAQAEKPCTAADLDPKLS